jgi:predicted TIM-barrel fold metal-dependent hydrolase
MGENPPLRYEAGSGDPVLLLHGFTATWQIWRPALADLVAHPDAYTPGAQGRPSALIEVAFETTRTFTDMLYAGLFRRFPNVTFVVAHCGAALPALSGRITLLGLESWVPNPNGLTATELTAALSRLYLDTAATCPTSLAAALAMTIPDQLVYGSDCGVPCTSEATMDRNLGAAELSGPDRQPEDGPRDPSVAAVPLRRCAAGRLDALP